MWYVRDVLYAVLYVRVSCFVVRGCRRPSSVPLPATNVNYLEDSSQVL